MAETMNAIIEAHRSALAACDSEDDPGGPLNTAERQAWKAFVAAPCTTTRHVQAKVAYVADSERLSGWVDDGMDDPLGLLRSLRLTNSHTAPDPMLALVTLHREGCAIYGAQTPGLSDEDDDALAAATWVPHYRALRDETPATTTVRGAAEAVREVLAELGDQEHAATFEAGVLRSVLAFLDGEAS